MLKQAWANRVKKI